MQPLAMQGANAEGFRDGPDDHVHATPVRYVCLKNQPRRSTNRAVHCLTKVPGATQEGKVSKVLFRIRQSPGPEPDAHVGVQYSGLSARLRPSPSWIRGKMGLTASAPKPPDPSREREPDPLGRRTTNGAGVVCESAPPATHGRGISSVLLLVTMEQACQAKTGSSPG